MSYDDYNDDVQDCYCEKCGARFLGHRLERLCDVCKQFETISWQAGKTNMKVWLKSRGEK